MIKDVFIVVAILIIVGGALFYIIRAKKRGQKCIGCPYAKQCAGNCNGSCNKK